MAVVIIRACDDVALARVLFTEYLKATIEETGLPNPEELPGVLEMMRRDIEHLPGPYVAPDGTILFAWLAEAPAGSVGVARVDERTAEIRRLWVRPTARRAGADGRRARSRRGARLPARRARRRAITGRGAGAVWWWAVEDLNL